MQKREEYKRTLKHDQLEQEDEIDKKIREERQKTLLQEKQIKHNAATYKREIDKQMQRIRERNEDPELIWVTASAHFKEKLIIEMSPKHKSRKSNVSQTEIQTHHTSP